MTIALENTSYTSILGGTPNFLHLIIYPVELVVKDTDSPNSATYFDLEHDINGILTTKLYDKRDDFICPIVNYPFVDSNIPSSLAYAVYMLQLIRYSRTCNSYHDFLHRSVLLTKKLLSKGFIETRLRSTQHNLTLPYRVSMTTMANDISKAWYCCHKYVSFLGTT